MVIPAGHVWTADEIARIPPIKGLLIANIGNPIAVTSGAVELDMSKYAFTGLSLVTGRYYMARYYVTYTKSVAADTFDFKVRTNTPTSGLEIGRTGFNPTGGGAGAGEPFEFVFKGDASYVSLYLSTVRVTGTGTLSYYGAHSTNLYRGWAELLDLGDSGNWADVA